MADWSAFAEAFLRDTASYINERKSKAEDYREQLKEQAERNKLKLSKLRSAAKTQQGFIGQAKGLHATDQMIEAALDAGPQGVQRLVAELSDLKTRWGTEYTPDLVGDYVKLPEAFKATGNLNPEDRYGIAKTRFTAGDVKAPESSFFAKAFGYDAKERARAELDKEMVGDTGLSVFDMAEISSIDGYESLNPTSFLTYVAPKRFNPASFDKARSDIVDVVREARLLPEYDVIKTKMADIDAVDPKDRKRIQEELQAQLDEVIQRQIQLHVNGQISLYGESYLKNMAPVLETFGYKPTVEAEPRDEVSTLVSDVNAALGLDSTIEVSELPEIFTKEAMGTLTIDDEEFETVKTPDGNVVLRDGEGGVLSVTETQQVVEAALDITYDQFIEQAKTTNTITAETPEEPVQEEVVREEVAGQSNNFLKQYGEDLLNHLSDAGVLRGDSDEDIRQEIAAWFSDNATDLKLVSLADSVSMENIIKAMRVNLPEDDQ